MDLSHCFYGASSLAQALQATERININGPTIGGHIGGLNTPPIARTPCSVAFKVSLVRIELYSGHTHNSLSLDYEAKPPLRPTPWHQNQEG